MKKLEVENLVGLSLAIHWNLSLSLWPLSFVVFLSSSHVSCLLFLSILFFSLYLSPFFSLFLCILFFISFSLSLCFLYLYPFFYLFSVSSFLSLSLFISLLYFLSFSLSSLSLPHFKSLKLLKLIFNFPSTHFSNFCTGRTQLKLYINTEREGERGGYSQTTACKAMN